MQKLANRRVGVAQLEPVPANPVDVGSQDGGERSLYKAEAGGSIPSPATNLKFKLFSLRWREPLGLPQCPYIVRWVLTVFGYSLRLHHWLGSDDLRHMHDHAWWYVSIILKGSYFERTSKTVTLRRVGSVAFYRAEHQHIVEENGGCWSLLITGRSVRQWGFYVPGRAKLLRPLRYFSRYGHQPCE